MQITSEIHAQKLRSLITFVSILFMLLLCQPSAAYESNQHKNIHSTLLKVFGERPYELVDHDEYLFEIKVGDDFYFITPDARYIFAGPVFDTHLMKNIAALRKNKQRHHYLNSYASADLIKYSSQNEKYVVTIFTDIACPYCRKMHQYIDEFNALGISIHYVMVPRGGKGSAIYKKTLSALCSVNPQQAIDQAMMNKHVSHISCASEDVLDNQIKLSQTLTITNTPSIVMPSGELRLGFMSPQQMITLLEQQD